MQRKQEFLEWLRSIERKWQKVWRERRVFEAEPKEGVPKYFLTIPYPYSNGPLHIGHGRTYTIGDIIARYKRLRGYNVLFPMAFHITGTPIIAYSEMISRGDEKTIKMYREYISLYVEDEREVESILESFKDPLNLATFFAERIQRDFEELGYSIDWRRKFHTGEPIYNKFVTWQYFKLQEKGLITRGDHIVTYCLLHKQPEGEDDIQDADVNPVEIVEYTAVKFTVPSRGLVLLAATLRPETLFGVTNVWVHPDGDYVVVEWRGEKLVLSEHAYVKLVHQHPEEEIKVVERIKGRSLIGEFAVSPFGDRVPILPAVFIDLDNATGIVYSEPSDAPYDYVALMELKRNPEKLREYGVDPNILVGVEPRKIIDVPGVVGHHAEEVVKKAGIESQLDPRLEELSREVYKEQFYSGVMIVDHPEFKGVPVKDAREKVKHLLYSEGKALPFYELNRKAWCRGGGEVIVAKIRGQWFINYNIKWLKEASKKLIESDTIKIHPPKYKKAFLDTIDWLDKRPCARKRGIGTKLPWDPEWIIESLSDSTIYMAFYTIAHIIREYNIPAEALTPEVFDYVFLGVGEPGEISAKTGIPVEALVRMRREFTYWYPVDHRHTGVPHISNHLTFYILHHLAIFGERGAPRLISLNETVIREGAKMSKSKGNVIPLRHITTRYSADLFRLYISWAASLDSVLDWREVEVDKVVGSLAKFVNIAREAVSIDPKTCRDEGSIYNEWFVNKFYSLLAKATDHLEKLEVREYVQTAFFDVLSLIDRYRDIVGDAYICGVRRILEDWIKALNPVIPHVTEEINSWLGSTELLSTSKWPTIPRVDEEVIVLFDSVESTIDDIKELMSLVKKERARVYIIIAPQWKREVVKMMVAGEQLRSIIHNMRTKFNMGGREMEVVETYNYYKRVDREVLERVVKTRSGREYEVYKAMAEHIKAKVPGVVEVYVLWEDEARSKGIPKAERALPLRPAIYIE
jgi:leucyl-tRNA synthetase